MAIEKMAMMNVVGLMEDVDKIAREIILIENIDITNALNEINNSHFTLEVEDENVDELLDMNLIKPLRDERDYGDMIKKIDKLSNIYEEKFSINKKYLKETYEFDQCLKNLDSLYNKIIKPYNKIEELKNELKDTREYVRNLTHIKDMDINFKTLRELEYFTYTFGTLKKEDIKKLKGNYENITAVVLHIGSGENGEVYLVISPKELELETNRILRSLNYHNIIFPKEFDGSPGEIIKDLNIKEDLIKKELENFEMEFEDLKNQYRIDIEECYSKVKLQEKVKEVENHMVSSNNFFYFSGWVPYDDKNQIESRLSKISDLIVIFKGEEDMEVGFKPPTKLKNNKIFKPFEYLVNMYGTPSYSEIDPTVFLSITYMFLFGAMFGDLGQGFVIFLGGILLRKKSSALGGILSRLGISSMIFGILYGSFFGFEDVFEALLIRPFENINTILVSAIVIGVVLLLLGYLFSILNAIKSKDLKEGAFGRNGLAGFLFYVTVILLVLGKVLGRDILSMSLGVTIIILLIILIIIREPLANLMLNKRPLYHEPAPSYYIESGFDIFETLLSMLSNTVSFIRVGAFALTHVGFFIAFETIAHIIGNMAGGVFILILGNVIIIGLEGLIVFIQGLRLEYYELFSKYYRGEGKEFKPIRLNN